MKKLVAAMVVLVALFGAFMTANASDDLNHNRLVLSTEGLFVETPLIDDYMLYLGTGGMGAGKFFDQGDIYLLLTAGIRPGSGSRFTAGAHVGTDLDRLVGLSLDGRVGVLYGEGGDWKITAGIGYGF